MNSANPLVSVVVPLYNHSAYIEQCLLSILNQTYDNIEIFVIDDGSSDDSSEKVKKLQQNYEFHFISQKNQGCAATLNFGIKLCRGKYISLCASDDYWDLRKIEEQVKFMEKFPSIFFSYCKNYLVDENDRILSAKTAAANSGLKGGFVFREIILQKFHPLPGYIFRKKLFDAIGLYEEGVWAEDFYMNLKIAEKYAFGFIDQFLSYYRFPSGFHKKLKSLRVSESHRYCIEKYRNSPCYEEALREWSYRNFVWYSSVTEHKKFAAVHMIKSIKYFYRNAYLKSVAKLFFLWR